MQNILSFLLLTLILFIKEGSSTKIWVAKADLHIDSSPVSIGTLTFTQKDLPLSPVRITGTLKKLVPNTRYHGFHVHMLALSDGQWNCSQAGDHWNPYQTKHGSRLDPIGQRHVGDLGNIWSDSTGSVTIDLEDSIIQLHNLTRSSILDKSIVIHKDEDDLGRGGHSDSHTTGHAGARIACGNIRLVDSVSASNQAINILWPFDLNTDDFYNIYNGVPVNNPSYVPSPVSTTAIHLRSSLQQSVTVVQPVLSFTHMSFTVECWIHPTTLSAYDNAIFAQCQNPSARNCLHLGIRNATLYMNYYEESLRGNSVLKTNNWYHVAFVFDTESLQLIVYLNGKQDAATKASAIYRGTNDNVTIGTSKISRTHHTYFDGYIDQMSVVSSVKRAEDMLLAATSMQLPIAREPTRNSNAVLTSFPSKECQAQMVIIEQQAKTIEQQVAMTQSLLQMSMGTVSAMWKHQQNQRICESNTSPPPSSNVTIPSYDFTPPNKVWCPWRGDCTQVLDQRGQMTVEMNQQISLPFELHMSISERPTNESYIIHLSIDERRVAVYKTVNGITTIINQTSDDDYILHDGNGIYWLSIDYANLFVKYGQGEVRDRCTLLKSDAPASEKDYLREIQYAHISFNNSRNVTELKRFEEKIRMKVGRNPVVDDPALIVVAPDQFTMEHHRNNTAISITRLHHHCQALYFDVIHWQFQDDAFPHLYEAIEHSLRSKTGWCHQKLNEKSNRFGQPNILATYLRITVGRNRGVSPGVPYVLEIWPPGHFSPIHAHANTYGIIRVLHGEINVKLYRTLSLKKQKAIHETTFYENQVTWLSAGLNQVHKLENKSPNKTCITIQAYEYASDEINNYEFFDYITNDGNSIRSFDPVSDMDYFDFKNLMIAEWNNRY